MDEKKLIKYKNDFNKENYDHFNLMLKKGNKDILRVFAKDNNISINQLINTSIYLFCKENNIDFKL